MKKIDIGQAVSILANIGVIAGIVFLGYELRQNTTAMKSTAAQDIYGQIAHIFDVRMDSEIMAIIIKGNEQPNSLTRVERDQYQAYLGQTVQAWQNIYFQSREGVYDSKLAGSWWQTMRNELEWPGFRVYWEAYSVMVSPEFASFVNSEVMKLEPTPGWIDRG